MKTIYLVTGAYGHLGNTVARTLAEAGETVRGLVLPNERCSVLDGYQNITIYKGDVCDIKSLIPFFHTDEPTQLVVIHTAGIVSISSKSNKKMFAVNIGGTRNIVNLCMETGARLVHVSSVHAIPELPGHKTIREVNRFHPKLVHGDYAKSKALASQFVLNAVREGLDAVIVHPSGIFGPNDFGNAHLTQMVMDYLDRRLRAGVKGGYDFVDVRDVAEGCILAAQNGQTGQCYILSNRLYTIHEVLDLLHEVSGRKPIKSYLPLWLAKATAPLAEIYYKVLRQPPLYTRYSLYTLDGNANFSHQKASDELGYRPRPLRETLYDTVNWLEKHERVKPSRSPIATQR